MFQDKIENRKNEANSHKNFWLREFLSFSNVILSVKSEKLRREYEPISVSGEVSSPSGWQCEPPALYITLYTCASLLGQHCSGWETRYNRNFCDVHISRVSLHSVVDVQLYFSSDFENNNFNNVNSQEFQKATSPNLIQRPPVNSHMSFFNGSWRRIFQVLLTWMAISNLKSQNSRKIWTMSWARAYFAAHEIFKG